MGAMQWIFFGKRSFQWSSINADSLTGQAGGGTRPQSDERGHGRRRRSRRGLATGRKMLQFKSKINVYMFVKRGRSEPAKGGGGEGVVFLCHRKESGGREIMRARARAAEPESMQSMPTGSERLQHSRVSGRNRETQKILRRHGQRSAHTQRRQKKTDRLHTLTIIIHLK